MSDFGNIGILTSWSMLILKIIVAKLSSCAKVKFGDFHYDVIVQMRGFLSFNNSKFKGDRDSLKPLLVF